ncbi:MAG: FAD-binding protein [candidate division KSB1 bacterium]|nr:FAD-binding protein [candidate division KSB1 bacterium]MDZ7336328.1 FAD-binding protein [candidate division KSB1 bacterium]MDZ7402380.1 FAD-binding protein [candidate division KSB1 bacterium]
MQKSEIRLNGISIPVYSLNTLIIGSGAASLNAAVNLFEKGQTDIAIVTDQWGGGTSNNTGSDKQTYYKLSLAGDQPDSPLDMARDLFKGGCMHGDIALCEAVNSVAAFFHLIQLGVPFPHDRLGAYVGYKTDHDPRQRATSAGPLTSHLMFEALAADVKRKGIPVFDGFEVIGLLTEDYGTERHVIGAVALDKSRLGLENFGFVLFNATNVVFGTGGPAGMYKTSVYPESQLGASGMAFEIGAIGNNLTESQFGIASIKFRWNLSGTYQQVIPRYISTDQNGNDPQQFLNHYFPDMGKLATAIFLKGYQWPFDPRKVYNYGSSLIDILVYQETQIKGRRVFLDFQQNPSGDGVLDDFTFEKLGPEAYSYLEKSGALFGTPIQRLAKMNQPAIDLYQQHGIDLSKEYLEIAVCAQHNNGGLKGNIWWESNIKHLFPVGEVNGTHGVYRPGGSALNSGQVGAMRAALFIAKRYSDEPRPLSDFFRAAEHQILNKLNLAKQMFSENRENTLEIWQTRAEIQERMSSCGAHIRNLEKVKGAVREAWALYFRMKNQLKVTTPGDLPAAFRNLDLCLTHALYLEAIAEYLEKGGKSRGSYLVLDDSGQKPCDQLDDDWRFSLTKESDFVNQKILEIHLNDNFKVQKQWVDIRPIPQEQAWFEIVWNEYRKDNIVQ